MKIIFIGKKSKANLTTCIDDYLKRISNYHPVQCIYLEAKKISSKMPEDLIKKIESEKVFSVIDKNEILILLDEGGEVNSSKEFAAWILREESNLRRTVFVVGGAYGFDKKLIERARFKISLSKMTFSHHLARLIFCEQLYRAFTIIKGEPYHHS